MHVAIAPLTQYAFMAWCLVKTQGQLYLYLREMECENVDWIHLFQDRWAFVNTIMNLQVP
jgi:hypothetical protein